MTAGGRARPPAVPISSGEFPSLRFTHGRSSFSGGDDNCIEVTFAGPVAAFRDSKNAAGPVLLLPAAALGALLTTTRH